MKQRMGSRWCATLLVVAGRLLTSYDARAEATQCDAKDPRRQVPVVAAYCDAIEMSNLTDSDKVYYRKHAPHSFSVDYVIARDVAVLLYDEAGSAIGSLPRIDEDDEVLVAVAAYKDTNALVKRVTVTSCDAPQLVRVGGNAGVAAPNDKEGPPQAPKPPVEDRYKVLYVANCSSDSGIQLAATIDVGGQESAPVIKAPTLPLYRLTVGLGLIDDFTRKTTYSAKSIKGENVPVIVGDRQNGGLAAVGFVTLHVAPVDLVRTRPVYQWFAPVVGVSLAHPTDHLYFGLGIDPLPGLGALVGWHALRGETLAGGFRENDRVPDGVVPTDKRWQTLHLKDMFLGVNLDAMVVAKLVTGLTNAK